MNRFEVGDLLRPKPSSFMKTDTLSEDLVLVSDSLSSSNRFFYGIVCSTGEQHLWSYDQFYLLSGAGKAN